MNKADKYIYDDINNILKNGYWDENPRPKYEDGTPAHTMSVNQVLRKYDLSRGEFPITSLRPIAWKSGIREIFTIYQKPTNKISEMEAMGVRWWNEWDIGDGTIGKRYGFTINHYDQMNKLLNGLINNPFGRRHIMDLYQFEDLESTDGLYPCAFLTIWNVRNGIDGKKYLDMTLVQRSGDMLTASGAGGVNESQYAALLMMVSRHCGYEVGVFAHFIQNEHIYDRHIEQANEMLGRWDRKNIGEYCSGERKHPTLVLNPEKTNFYDMTIEDFTMENYEPIKPQLNLPLGI